MKRRAKYFINFIILSTVLGCLLCGCTAADALDEVAKDMKVNVTSSDEEVRKEPEAKESEEKEESRQTVSTEIEQEGESQEVPATSKEDGESGESFLDRNAYEYARQYLNEAELLWYHDISNGLGVLGTEFELDSKGLEAGLTEEDIDKVFQCVLNDHPELFYVDGYSYMKYSRGNKLVSIKFSGTYTCDAETVRERAAQINRAADAVLSGISGETDQYTKVKYVYDMVIKNTEYDYNAPDNQNIYSVFVNKRSVCQGYAKSVQFLLNRLGIESTLVLGMVNTGEGHAWNLVKIDGSYYYLDATWGDASYNMDTNGGQGQSMPEINYDYLNVTTDELLKTHTIDNCVAMPACVSMDANYYCREGAYFTAYNPEQMKQLIDRAVSLGKSDITIKCADDSCYNNVIDQLIGQQKIFDFLGSGNSIAYSQNDKQRSLTFWMTK